MVEEYMNNSEWIDYLERGLKAEIKKVIDVKERSDLLKVNKHHMAIYQGNKEIERVVDNFFSMIKQIRS